MELQVTKEGYKTHFLYSLGHCKFEMLVLIWINSCNQRVTEYLVLHCYHCWDVFFLIRAIICTGERQGIYSDGNHKLQCVGSGCESLFLKKKSNFAFASDIFFTVSNKPTSKQYQVTPCLSPISGITKFNNNRI